MRVARFESLESRRVLASPTLGVLPDSVIVKAGAPLNIALNGSDPDNDFSELLFFDVTTTVTTGNPQLTATVVEQFPYPGGMNQSLRISVDTPDHSIQGDMVFQLFEEWAPKTTARIIDLARIPLEDGKFFYEDLTFHRVARLPDGSPFVIQGGDPAGDGSGGSGVDFDDEFHPRLQFTSPGVLAMAKSSNAYGSIDDTNDSQFFITGAPTRWLDFEHSIFGFLTQGENIRQQIQAIPDNNDDGKPDVTVTINEVDVFLDLQNCVLNLSAPDGFTGEADVTVTVSDFDPDSQPFFRTFHVKVEADTTNNNPFLESISPIETSANTPVTFTLPATDVEGDAIYYAGMVDPTNTNLTINVNSSTGQTTVTPLGGFAGVSSVLVGVQPPSGGSVWDTQEVPVYVKPAAPTVQLLASSDTGSSSSDGITNLNNTVGRLLGFRVLGTVEGAEVTLYADGVEIGRGIASPDSLVLYTNGTAPLTDAPHAITATQTLLDRAVNVGNLHERVDLASAPSATVTITVDTVATQFTSWPELVATEGEPYAYDAQTNEEAGGGVVYQLTVSPGGMVINTQTGMVGWNPLPDQVPSQAVTIGATDKAGNVTEQTFRVQVRLVNSPPTANSQSLTAPADGSRLITLTGSDGDTEVIQGLSFAIGTSPGRGALTRVSTTIDTATYRYTPTPGYIGPDSFTFTVTDDATAGDPAGQTSGPESATVSLNVVSVNHSPTANPQSRTLDEDASIVITLTGDDGEAAIVQTLTFQVAQSPAHGSLSNFSASAGTVTYTPSANYNGSDFFSFRVIDDDRAGDPASLASETAVVSLSITPLNDAPAATAQALTVTQNVAQVITLAGADNDPEVAQGLTFQIATGPSHGTLGPVNQTTRQVTYTPEADSSGPDSFTFTVTDDAAAGGPGPLGSTAATVSINVNAVNTPPVANAQNATTAEDTTLSFTLTGDDRDAEVTQTLRFNLVAGPSHGTITSFNPATGAVAYRPAPDFNGPDSIRFTVTDDAAAGAPASLTSAPAEVSIQVTAVDDAPRFAPIAPLSVLQGQTLRLFVHAVDPDVPPNAVRYELVLPKPPGAAIGRSTGELTWKVPQDYPVGITWLKVRAYEVLPFPGGPRGWSTVQTIAVEVIDFRLAVFASLDLGRPGPADVLPGPDPLGIPSLLSLGTAPGPIAPVVPLPGFGSAGLGDQTGWLLRATFSGSSFSPDMGYGLGQGSGPAVEPEGEKRPATPPAEQPKAEDGAPTPGTPRRGDRSERSDDADKPRSRAALPDRRSEHETPRQLNDLVLESLDDARAFRLALTDPVEPMPIVQDGETVSTAAAAEEPAGPWLAAALDELEAWVAAVVETAVGGS